MKKLLVGGNCQHLQEQESGLEEKVLLCSTGSVQVAVLVCVVCVVCVCVLCVCVCVLCVQ